MGVGNEPASCYDIPHEYSDIDLAVFVNDIPNENYHKDIVEWWRLRIGVDYRKEPNLFYWDANGYEPASFENYIIKNGIILYQE